MPPKPAPPSQDMKDRHEKGVKLETTVDGLLQHGALGQAQRVFDKDWTDTLLHSLPLRHAFLLDRPERAGVTRLLDLAEEGEPIELVLMRGVDRRRKKQIAVGISGEDIVVGWLPQEVLDILEEAGDFAEIYEPKILAARGLQTGKIQFEMEIARPDLRQCSACNRIHMGEHENCDDCRSKRRRKKRKLEETAEPPPVPVAQAFHNIAEAHQAKKSGS